MKHTLIVIAFLLGLVHIGYAQSKMQLRLSTGISMPVADFKLYTGQSSGYALLGSKSSIELGYGLNKHLGTVLFVDYGVYGTDATKISEAYLTSNQAYTKVAVVSGYYSVMSIMVGIEPTVSITEKVNLTGQLAFGMSNIKGPENEVYVSTSSPFEQAVVTGTANAFAYAGKITLNYSLNEKFQFGLFGGYSATKPAFSIKNASSGVVSTTEQSITVITTGLQLTYKL